MKNLVSLVVILFIALACGTSKYLRSLDYNNPIPQGLSKDAIKQAIVSAGAQKGWVVVEKEGAQSTLTAKLNVRTHYVEVDIPYTKENYKIVYVKSENMKYNAAKNTIHRSYNRWVMNLKANIDSSLAVAIVRK